MIEEPELAFLVIDIDEEHDEELDHNERQLLLVTDQRTPVEPIDPLLILFGVVKLDVVGIPRDHEFPISLIKALFILCLEHDGILHGVQLLVNVGQNDEQSRKEDYIHKVHDLAYHSWGSIEIEQDDKREVEDALYVQLEDCAGPEHQNDEVLQERFEAFYDLQICVQKQALLDFQSQLLDFFVNLI